MKNCNLISKFASKEIMSLVSIVKNLMMTSFIFCRHGLLILPSKFRLAAQQLKVSSSISLKNSNTLTDYNTHDPGITILEVLCYAITDLAYRIGFPVEDLLAVDGNNFQAMHDQFLTAINIFPSRPVTVTDYRKLIIDIPGINNAW